MISGASDLVGRNPSSAPLGGFLCFFLWCRRLVSEGGLGGREPCDRNAVGRAAYVIQPDSVTEGHAIGVAAVFTANAQLNIGALSLASFNGDLHEATDTALVDTRERIGVHDLQFLVAWRKDPESSRLIPSVV